MTGMTTTDSQGPHEGGSTRTGGTGAAHGLQNATTRMFLLVGLVITLALAGIVSYYASGSPDGLEKVASERGFDESVRDHHLAGSPLADYRTKNVDNARLSGGLAGVIGVGATLLAATGVVRVVARRRSSHGDGAGAGPSAAAKGTAPGRDAGTAPGAAAGACAGAGARTGTTTAEGE